MPAENPKRLLEYLAEGLVEDPEAVTVEQFEENDGTVVLELCVAAALTTVRSACAVRPPRPITLP